MPRVQSLTQALLAALLVTSALLPAGEATPGETTGGDLPPIDWWAVNQFFVEDKGAIVLSGSAWIRYRGIKLQADHIVRTTLEIRLLLLGRDNVIGRTNNLGEVSDAVQIVPETTEGTYIYHRRERL